MAKIRVYELARELNMSNKALLDKIEKMKISVRSHMSALDDNIVITIREKLRATSKQIADIDEKRVKSTVIRRRKKHVKGTHHQKDRNDENKQVSHKDKDEKILKEKNPIISKNKSIEKTQKLNKEEKQVVEKSDVKRYSKADSKDGFIKKDVQDKQDHKKGEKNKNLSDESTDFRQKSRKKKKKRKKRDEPAKILKMPEPNEVEEESNDTEIELKKDKDNTKFKEKFIKGKSEKPEKIVETKKEHISKDKKDETGEPSKSFQKDRKKKKKKKKAKKDTPAKIIKQADVQEEIPEIENEEVKVFEKEVEKGGEKGSEKGSEKESYKDKKKKKKSRKWQDSNDEDYKFFNKKISFRKKSVIEGSALYSEKFSKSKSRKGMKGQKSKANIKIQKTQITTPKAIKRRIKVDEAIVLAELAKRMGVKAGDLIKKLMDMGVMTNLNQALDYETASLVASEFGFEISKASFEEETLLASKEDDPENLKQRPPVVTIMGHVDHGKTSLLDAIRETRVTEREAGGITQHIGAYNVQTERGQIVFLDTPGHEAFTAMRSRGAKVTDIVVLVVAADDGVMPQTIEAINHSKAAEVPIIIAVNKIDKDGADTERVKRELSEKGLVPEEWGGEHIFVNVSAKQKTGIDNLLEMISLQAEVMELKANPDKMARGHVVEAKIDAGRGPVATVLVQEGTLRKGDPIVCGVHFGKVRALINDLNLQIDTATPSIPVEIVGLSGVPMAGDEFIITPDEKTAKQVSTHRLQKQRNRELTISNRISLENFFEKMKEEKVKNLNLIIKADVHGSIEALEESLNKLSGKEVKIEIIHSATGTITESDISLAAVSDAIIIGFNVRPNSKIVELANEENVDIKYYEVIYNVINDIKDAVVGLMASTYEEEILGRAEIREIFTIPKIGIIAGSYITDGKVERGQFARLIRDGIVCYKGKIGSLRRFKDDAKEVVSGYECGIGIENYNDLKIGDIIECYYMKEIKPVFENGK